MRTTSLTLEKPEGFIQNGVTPASLSFKSQATKQTTVKWSIAI